MWDAGRTCEDEPKDTGQAELVDLKETMSDQGRWSTKARTGRKGGFDQGLGACVRGVSQGEIGCRWPRQGSFATYRWSFLMELGSWIGT